MPRFINAKLNNDILDQSAHGKDETPEGCTCDLYYEQFCITSVDAEDAANSSSSIFVSKVLEPSHLCDYSSKEIEERWEFPEVDGFVLERALVVGQGIFKAHG